MRRLQARLLEKTRNRGETSWELFHRLGSRVSLTTDRDQNNSHSGCFLVLNSYSKLSARANLFTIVMLLSEKKIKITRLFLVEQVFWKIPQVYFLLSNPLAFCETHSPLYIGPEVQIKTINGKTRQQIVMFHIHTTVVPQICTEQIWCCYIYTVWNEAIQFSFTSHDHFFKIKTFQHTMWLKQSIRYKKKKKVNIQLTCDIHSVRLFFFFFFLPDITVSGFAAWYWTF